MTHPITLKPITADEVHALDAQGMSREIINGQWVEFAEGETMAAGKQHGKIGAKIVTQFVNFLEDKNLGEVYQDNVGYVLEGTKDNIELMLIPDVSFVTASRVVSGDPDDFYYQAPDIAIEIISPSERVSDIRKKVKYYLDYGTRQVWLVYPETQEIVVNLADGTARSYPSDTKISVGDWLPDFEFETAKIFN